MTVLAYCKPVLVESCVSRLSPFTNDLYSKIWLCFSTKSAHKPETLTISMIYSHVQCYVYDLQYAGSTAKMALILLASSFNVTRLDTGSVAHHSYYETKSRNRSISVAVPPEHEF